MATSVGPVVSSPVAVGYTSGGPQALAPGGDQSEPPQGFPVSFASPLAWTGHQCKDTARFIHTLDRSEIAEVEAALDHFKEYELDGSAVCPEKFPLPVLGPKLERLSREIYNGIGFAVIRGLNPTQYSVEDLTVIWLGIQGYIANRCGRQDRMGNMLVHIHAENRSELQSGHHRHSTSSITFHNEESGDIVGWLTRSTASAGGKCIIASGYTVYNVLAATRPDLIRVLARGDWPFALPHFQCRPVIYMQDGRLIMNVGRTPLLGNAAHPRPAHLPTLNSRQMEALDCIESIARATQLEIQTQPGDIHFINNLAVLHRRDAFVDGDAPEAKRHLVRTRLRSDALGWSIPSELQKAWDDAFKDVGNRVWHLEPMPQGYFPLRYYPN